MVGFAKEGGLTLPTEGIGRGAVPNVRLEEVTVAAVPDDLIPATSACLYSYVPEKR